jgi:hypothetical protein
MKRGAHLGANKNAGGSPYFFYAVSLFCFPAQSTSGGSRGNEPHLPRSLLYSRRVDGVIQPRSSIHLFLEGKCDTGRPHQYTSIRPDVIPPSTQRPIATLAHGLERVLFK